jgi:hypothetical protein
MFDPVSSTSPTSPLNHMLAEYAIILTLAIFLLAEVSTVGQSGIA